MNEELGVFLTLLSAGFMGLTLALTRRGTMYTSAFNGLVVPLAVSIPLFLIAAAASGQLGQLGNLALWAYPTLLGVGMLHYGLGRFALLRSLYYLGANRSAPFRAMTPLFAVALGLALLDERLTLQQTFGVMLVIVAPLAMLVRRHPSPASRHPSPASHRHAPPAGGSEAHGANATDWRVGVFYAVLSAAAYGVSQFLVRAVISDTDMAVMGALLTNVGGGLLMAGLLASPSRLQQLRSISSAGLRWFVVAGLTVSIALLFRFAALETAPVSIVTPVFETNVFFAIVFGYFINRQGESFGRGVIVAVVLSVAGTLAITM
jgi:drug/metabolite transporter (DMT)-like permease